MCYGVKKQDEFAFPSLRRLLKEKVLSRDNLVFYGGAASSCVEQQNYDVRNLPLMFVFKQFGLEFQWAPPTLLPALILRQN